MKWLKVKSNNMDKQLSYDAFMAGKTLGYFGDDAEWCREETGYGSFEEWWEKQNKYVQQKI